jgi:hypothetical protein
MTASIYLLIGSNVFIISLRNRASLVASVAAIYSASAVNRATYSYRFNLQLIDAPYIKKI